MNILFLTLLYRPEQKEAVAQCSRDGLQNQNDSFQWALIDGLKAGMGEGETLSILNALPVGVYPTHYRKLWLPGSQTHAHFRELASLNLPWFKQRMRMWLAERYLEQWIAASPYNRTILLYTLYLPYMQAIARVKQRHPDVQTSVIVTDLPNELGIASGRNGLLKRIEYWRGRRCLSLVNTFDGYVLLTQPMADALHIDQKPAIVLEGLVVSDVTTQGQIAIPEDRRPAVLYSGTLNRELGIAELLTSFQGLDGVQLWLCGRGDMVAEVEQAAKENRNIHYFGFVAQETALALQTRASALINPRTAQGIFTRYSFPSKTLEYMRSGKPVLCCKLEGIPDEYDAYLRYIDPQTPEGIRAAVLALFALPKQERSDIGVRSRHFALEHKNNKVQALRVLSFLNQLHHR